MPDVPPALVTDTPCLSGCRIPVRPVPSRAAHRVFAATARPDRAHSGGGTSAALVAMETKGEAAGRDDAAWRLAQFEPDPESDGQLPASGCRADTIAWVTWNDAESELTWVIDELAQIMPRR